MKEKLQIVKLAYHDHACLHFRISANRPQAARAARIIGGYNGFEPKTVVRFIRALPIGTRFQIGREESPVLYVHTPDWLEGTQRATILKAAETAGLRFVDEFDETGVWHRLWWD